MSVNGALERKASIPPTVLLSPTAEVLVQVEAGFAISNFEISQPFGNDVEQGRIQSDGRADEGDDNPSLRRIIRPPELISPASLSCVVEARRSFPPRLSSGLFSRRILDPIWELLSVLGASEWFVGSRRIPMVVKSYSCQYRASQVIGRLAYFISLDFRYFFADHGLSPCGANVVLALFGIGDGIGQSR
jgi:hypothetical protein